MITDIIVLSSIAFVVVSVVAWMVSPGLRAWIERPKHRFQDAVREYDRSERRKHQAGGGHSA